jgi:hypothetical protein
VVIVSGETGSGKSTQIPKFCLAAGRGLDGMIGHTQPRRIAAVAVAQRIAEELGQPLGHAVGYKIRFSDRTARDAYIKIMTDGILLAETQTDRRLSAYDTIIVDEAHERNLNIDFILGYLKRLVERRRDLKVVITSATIDTEKFSRAFGGAPVIDVTGRTFPVEVRYADPETVAANNGEVTHVELAVQAVADIARERREGDVLVFMPTCRSSRASPPPTRRACSGPPAAARSSWRPTWPRRPSRFPASATWWTQDSPGSRAIPRARGPPRCRWRRSRAAARTSARAAAAAWNKGSASVCTRRRTTWRGRSTPPPRSCAPIWPRSSCA